MLDKFWVEKRESGKLILIQVHHENLVSGSQIRSLRRELTIEVAHVFSVAL